jgi:GTP-binding protein LepA
VLVVDATQGVQAQTLANVYLALEHDHAIVPVLNKIDLPSAEPDRVRREIEDTIGLDASGAILASAKEGVGTEEILEAIVRDIPAPKGDPAGPLRALIFDSWFDSYHGAVSLVRVVDGMLSKGQAIRLMAVGKEFLVTRLCVLAPRAVEVAGLGPGEVGILSAAIKEVADTKIGDTVTDAERPATAPLPGFRPVKPMVFAGLYPADSADYDALREAVDKLRLNDSSFTYEPETSLALGFGFRCGFLGLLHMEIIQERLEREFELALITTAPTVAYRVVKTNGDAFVIDSPAKLPNPMEIDRIEEPYIRATIHLPTEFVGNVLQLCQDRRGEQKEMKYLGETRVMVTYELPLSEVDDPRLCLDGLRVHRLPPVEPREARPPHQRRPGRRPLGHRASRQRLRARPRPLPAPARAHPAPDVRGRDPGGHRREGDRARDRQSDAQERDGEVLRRRHHAQAQAPREAEGGEEAHEAGRPRRNTAGGVPRGAEGWRVNPPSSRMPAHAE